MKKQIKSLVNGGTRLMQWPLWGGCLCLALARGALAADPLYYNELIRDFGGSDGPPPEIHATNFVNVAGGPPPYESYGFNVYLPSSSSSSSSSAGFIFFETWDTLNYTNTGSMVTDTGFKFDTQVTNGFGSTLHLMAANFYNPGYISCASSSVTLSTVGSSTVVSSSGLAGQLIVNATNISMPGGTVDVGTGGLISFVGQNVDLSSSTLTLGSGSAGGMGSVAAIPNDSSYTYAGFGTDTNAEWNPFQYLTASSALPSLARMGTTTPASWYYPFGDGYYYPSSSALPLATTPFWVTNTLATNSIVYRHVFVANSDPSVTFNVYMDPSVHTKASSYETVVEFVGSYVDPATGLPANNYLYVTDDYLQGVNNTKINSATGIPNNFTFTVTGLQQSTGVASLPPDINFYPFPNVAISNSYSFADVQCVSTSITTNGVTLNTNNYLAVLPGRIVIDASDSLNLSHVQISGQNYTSVNAPNLLGGSGNTTIASAYSSLNVGVASGNMMATNLLQPSIPAWSGYAQAWSTRWIQMTTNSLITYSNNLPVSTNSFAVTNDYRVAIVANQASPTAPTAVWDLSLHGTNSIVISDEYNILHGLNLDCVSLTLTTNGTGAQSPFGMLNLQNTGINWAAATPNLRYLTNYGDIYLPLTGVNSLGIFGTAGVPYGALLNFGIIEDGSSQIWADNFVNGGTFYNIGQFTLHSRTTTLAGGNSGGYLYAGGAVSITTGSLVLSNAYIEADRSLTITATNQFTDTGVANGGLWYVGRYSVTGDGIRVLGAPPATGGVAYGNSLLGTTIEQFAPSNKIVANVWAGADKGATPAGFTNNLAVGMFLLDSLGSPNNTRFNFSGAGVSNALYVDYLEFADQATLRDTNGNPAALNISSNLVIYYAQAVMNGVSVARKLDGKANGHLRWVPDYAGHFSSTNIVYNGVSYAINAALAQDSQIDSDGDSIPNSVDSSPFFLSGMVTTTIVPTNGGAMIIWPSVPLATNYLYFSTNNATGPFNSLLTNFITPAPYPGPITNVMVFDPDPSGRFYRPMVYPWLTYPF
jgi:hypothetical protein